MKKSVITITCVLLCSLMFGDLLFADSKELKIAMIVWRGETKAENGFQDGLKEIGYSAQYTLLNAEQDRDILSTMLREKLTPDISEFDYIYSFGTTVSQMVRSSVKDRVPHIFNIVTAPVESGIVKSMEASGGNVTGICHRVSLELQIETVLRIVQFKKLGLLYNPREDNSNVIKDKFSYIAKKYGLAVINLPSPPVENMLESNLEKIANKSIVVDVVYLPLDSFLISKAQLICDKLKTARVVSIGSQEDYIQKGAMIGVIPDYYQLGKVASKILDRHYKGEKMEMIPVHTVKNPKITINETTRKLLDISIPEDLLEKADIVD